MVTDLPDYEKKTVVVTIPGDYPSEMQVDLRKILGVALLSPTVEKCVPVSIEHIVKMNHWQILGEALKTPTFANCVPTSIENDAIAYDATHDRFKVDIEAMTVGAIDVNVTDKWARQLGLVDLSRVLGSALSYSNPVIVRLTNGTTWLDPTQIRTLTSTDVVTVNNLLNPHPVDIKADSLGGLKVVEKNATGVKVDIVTDTLAGLKVIQSNEALLKATVTQAAKDRTISSVDATGTAVQIDITGLNGNSSALTTVGSGKAVRLKLISIEHSAAVCIGFRFGTTGTIYYMRTTSGPYLVNLIHANIQGAANSNFYLYSNGATNVKGFFVWQEV